MTGPFITTASGIRFPLLNPRPEFVRLGDIVHALAGLNRFTGHGSAFYSVAEHSVAVSRRVRELGGTDWQIRQALLHDAPEAYVGDASSPLKRAMRIIAGDDGWSESHYDIIERRVWEAVSFAFDVPVVLHTIVRKADHELADIEGQHLLPGWGGALLGETYRPRCLRPSQAAGLFRDMLAVHGVKEAA